MLLRSVLTILRVTPFVAATMLVGSIAMAADDLHETLRATHERLEDEHKQLEADHAKMETDHRRWVDEHAQRRGTDPDVDSKGPGASSRPL